MPKISRIEPQKKKGRFNLFLDDKFLLGVSEKVIIALGLREGQEISAQKIKEFEQKEAEARTYLTALRLLSYRPRSEKEIRDKLKRKGIDERLIKKTISRFKKENLVNDKEFVRFWLRNRQLLNPRGKKLLFLELRQKGVAEELIQKIFQKEYNQDKEMELARRLAEKKLKNMIQLTGRKKREKLIGFLLRRGFGWEIIKKVIEN